MLSDDSTDEQLQQQQQRMSGNDSTTMNSNNNNTANQYVGAATAGTRALLSQFIALYARVPVKLFRPTRVDYLMVPRAVNPAVASSLPYSFKTHSSLALLKHAVNEYGFRFITEQVLPPLIANSMIGVVLYTTYLTALPLVRFGSDNESGSIGYRQAFLAGGIAGAMQSLAAAPVDAIFHRFSVSELLIPDDKNTGETRHKSLWRYGFEKLQSIGVRGVMAGYSLSFVKESAGFAVFFSTFEGVKQWSYRHIVESYGAPVPRYADAKKGATVGTEQSVDSIREKPSAALYPATVLGAGAAASIALQGVQYPLSRLQNIHLTMLEALDYRTLYRSQNKNKDKDGIQRSERVSGRKLAHIYVASYRRTLAEASRLKDRGRNGGSWLKWMYRGFVRHALGTVPSSSVGLFVFEIMRIRYMEDFEGVELDDVVVLEA
ncbi:mitochondrial carrier domain-containing protein [Myxozyma melibiosi]|uniref:Mitochondrial carrier domain-containing protein n=1 Tax=Myxozyma melibiosi TaxID=54550 RepID=A0ABR1EYA5_9ASCO